MASNLPPAGNDGTAPSSVLTPGSDADAAAGADRTFEVRITAPASGAAFESGAEVAFHAEIAIAGETILPSRVRWTLEGVEPVTAAIALGTGTIVTSNDLPVGLHLVPVTATLPGVGAMSAGLA